MRRKSSKKENLPVDEKAKSAKTEAESGPNSFQENQQQVADQEEKQEPPVEVGADQVHQIAYEYELPTPTYTEELEIGKEIVSELSDDAFKAEETDIELAGHLDSVDYLDFQALDEEKGESALAEVDLLFKVEDMEEVEDGVSDVTAEVEEGEEDNDVEEMGGAEAEAELIPSENEAFVADKSNIENAGGDWGSSEEAAANGDKDEAAGEAADVPAEEAADVAADAAADEEADDDKDRHQPELEEDELSNRPRTFLDSHISAGSQVKFLSCYLNALMAFL